MVLQLNLTARILVAHKRPFVVVKRLTRPANNTAYDAHISYPKRPFVETRCAATNIHVEIRIFRPKLNLSSAELKSTNR